MELYFSSKELSKKIGLSTRHVRRLIRKQSLDLDDESLIYKDKKSGCWYVHESIVDSFRPKNIQRKKKEYALTIDTSDNINENDLISYTNYVLDASKNIVEEVDYTIDFKKKNHKPHLHMLVTCNDRTALIRNFRDMMGSISFKEKPVYDREGWINYMTKNNTLKLFKFKNI